MALHGMRIAESVAIEWSDIDFEKNTIYIHQQITDTGEIDPRTKTKASTRYVPLQSATKQLLLEIPEEKELD